jgi:hypothetical protein
MRNLRQLRSALVFAMLIGTGIIASSPLLHAAASDKSKAVRCANLQQAIAIANAAGNTELAASLQSIYDGFCVAQ